MTCGVERAGRIIPLERRTLLDLLYMLTLVQGERRYAEDDAVPSIYRLRLFPQLCWLVGLPVTDLAEQDFGLIKLQVASQLPTSKVWV